MSSACYWNVNWTSQNHVNLLTSSSYQLFHVWIGCKINNSLFLYHLFKSMALLWRTWWVQSSHLPLFDWNLLFTNVSKKEYQVSIPDCYSWMDVFSSWCLQNMQNGYFKHFHLRAPALEFLWRYSLCFYHRVFCIEHYLTLVLCYC